MSTTLLSLIGIALAASSIGALASPEVAVAAKNFHPEATWHPESVLTGDFSCRGKKEQAILGTSQTEIVVAVFLEGTEKKPVVLKYSTKVRSAESVMLTVEDLDFKVNEFRREAGPLPQGLQPSKSCKGLNMSDQMVDSAHIYWNRKAKRFDDWVR